MVPPHGARPRRVARSLASKRAALYERVHTSPPGAGGGAAYNRGVDERPQRLRVAYRKAGNVRYVAHLDLMRTWERALRRARLPLAYSQGFSPHARLALGAPLAVGFAGERELLDVWMTPRVEPLEVARRLRSALPEGLEVLAVEEVAHELPSLQSEITSATYELVFDRDDLDAEELRWRVEGLLAAHSLEWEEQRGQKTRVYDLRATVRDLEVRDEGERVVLALDLEAREGLTGRPLSVLEALGERAAPCERRRTGLRLGAPEPAPAAAEAHGS
jgi:radical SAM-linked protein